MTLRGAVLTVVAVVLLCGVAAAAVFKAADRPSGPTREADAAAVAAGKRFLDRYVARNGRVVRRDEGGDTVSEGQAYAMLVAVAIGDEARFRRVWRWTQRELQRRSDHLLSWRWADGRRVDVQPAADADLDAARALVLASNRFNDPGLGVDGRLVARDVLRHEVLPAGRGRQLLLAGPWARAQRIINPSYVAPRTYGILRRAEPDARWGALAADARIVARDLLTVSPFLPPDWAQVQHGGRLQPIGRPSRPRAMPRFGLDAQRLPVRFAESCSRDDRSMAARMWSFLRDHAADDGLAQSWDLRGRPSPAGPHALTYVAAAAAAAAAGDGAERDALLDRARDQDRRHPTYYGAAWAALGRLMLQTERLNGCALREPGL